MTLLPYLRARLIVRLWARTAAVAPRISSRCRVPNVDRGNGTLTRGRAPPEVSLSYRKYIPRSFCSIR